jgi:hypothetical protein
LSQAAFAAASDRSDPIWIRYFLERSGLDTGAFGTGCFEATFGAGGGTSAFFAFGVATAGVPAEGAIFATEGATFSSFTAGATFGFWAGTVAAGALGGIAGTPDVGGTFGTSNLGAGKGGVFGFRAIGVGSGFSGGGNNRSTLRPSVDLSILP